MCEWKTSGNIIEFHYEAGQLQAGGHALNWIYWVVSRDCNQKCAHCYNDSGPGAPGLTLDQATKCVENLPDPDRVAVGRIVLSGGEVLVWPELLFHTLGKLYERYGDATLLYVQTNGDLLTGEILQRMREHKVCKVDVASMDTFHRKGTLERKDLLVELFERNGFSASPLEIGDDPTNMPSPEAPQFAFWGATEEMWIGPLWPRGRARKYNFSRASPEHRFCSIWSGAKGFLDYHEPGNEINVQLADVYPCCPMTFKPIGSLLEENLIDMLDRCKEHPVFRALNEGMPEKMGEYLGISEEEGFKRSAALGNHCLWCDEFFAKYAPELLYGGGMTERGTVDLDIHNEKPPKPYPRQAV